MEKFIIRARYAGLASSRDIVKFVCVLNGKDEEVLSEMIRFDLGYDLVISGENLTKLKELFLKDSLKYKKGQDVYWFDSYKIIKCYICDVDQYREKPYKIKSNEFYKEIEFEEKDWKKSQYLIPDGESEIILNKFVDEWVSEDLIFLTKEEALNYFINCNKKRSPTVLYNDVVVAQNMSLNND